MPWNHWKLNICDNINKNKKKFFFVQKIVIFFYSRFNIREKKNTMNENFKWIIIYST
jgi:hypothetical protein